MTSTRSLAELKKADQLLLSTLEKRLTVSSKKGEWRNVTLRKMKRACESEEGLKKVRALLERSGAFTIRCERKRWTDLDGQVISHTLARAATTDMWPMGTHYWLRDNALIGARYLFSRNPKFKKVGRSLLLSGLSFMSSLSQLERFERMIQSSSKRFHEDPKNWPYIFAGVKDNLSTRHIEGWAHKQDAWQIVAFYVLEAIDQGLLSVKDLTAKHRKFLTMVVPFLAKISFWQSENSGSWEELPAVRTSVRAWDHRLLVKIAELSERREFSFLVAGFGRFQKALPAYLRDCSLAVAVRRVEQRAIPTILRDLPFESPNYAKRDPRYREADSALLYLLLMDYPAFLAVRAGKDARWAAVLESRIVKVVNSLIDKQSGGIQRYLGDCYQRVGYFRNVTVRKLDEISGGPSGDASQNFVARGRAVPQGRGAAWTHFVWQYAAWSGERYLATGASRYKKTHDRLFLQGMALFTGQKEVSVDLNETGSARIIRIPAFRMPECYITEVVSGEREVIFPSPHTPLNWAVAEMFNAFHVRTLVLRGFSKAGVSREKR